MNNISESLFQAVDILMSSKMHDMKYDKTVLCKIENSPNKEKGEYIVSDGSSKFVAYSENTSYQDGASVYVTIPGGDYNNRKLIAGRYVEDNGEYFTYRAPFEDYLDITENLIEDDLSVASLLANGSTKEITLWSRNFEQEREESGREDYVGIGKGYQTLGINAKFRSWLGALSPVSGDFGLRLDVVGRETATSKTPATEKYYSFYLTTKDMFGNVYNFETYYTQEKIFDISMIEEVARMQLVFYQSGDFVNKAGDLIPIEKDGVALTNNLFIKEPYVSLGYSVDSFTEDTILLYTFDSLTYTPQASPEQNEKRLQARWIHFDEEGQPLAIDKESEIPLEAKLHWYKFILTEGVTDELAGNFWQEITEPELLNKLFFKFNPDIAKQNEKYKIIVEYPSRDIIQTEIDDGLAVIDADRDKYSTEEEYIAARETFILEQQSRIMYLYSEVFTFENEVACVNDATVDLVQALQIVCDPKEKGGLQGNYCIYDMTNELLNPIEGRKVRQLEATYKSLVTGEESLDKAASITWKIPIANTMIYLPEEGVEYFTEVDEEAGEIPDEISGDGTFLYITRRGTENYDVDPEVTELQIEVLQNFRIKSYYTQNATNNTIYCSITKNNRVYEASTTLAFGPMGTNGTDVTLIPLLADNASAIVPGQTIDVGAKLYDYENKEIPIEKITWSWWSTDGNIGLDNVNSNPCTITAVEDDRIYHNILCCRVRYQEVDLEAYLPIPIKSSDKVKYAEVPSRVVYDANGSNAAYYKNPLRVINSADDTLIDGDWRMELEDSEPDNANYYPHIKESADGVKMIPPSMYFSGLSKGITLAFENADGDYWYQPILILQNRWPSAMLNSWDGSLTIDEENGTILSTMVGAGKKEDDNSFTGVLMGDVETGSGDKTIKKTGVYGYNHGMQSFGFMDDGKAFIGKAGKGRIEFNGNNGWIQSMSYSTDKTGMRIDLDDGIIDIRGAKKIKDNNTYTSDSEYQTTNSQVTIQSLDPYLIIKTENAEEIMRIGSEKYYLQSEGYVDDDGVPTGAKLDIAKGVFKAYDIEGSGSYVQLSGNGNPFFRIHNETTKTDIFYAGFNASENRENFYLQSSFYKSNRGMRIDLTDGIMTTYDKDGSGSYIKIDASGSSLFNIYYAPTKTTLMNVGGGSYYLQSANYKNQSGMHIDMMTGGLTAYDKAGNGTYVKIDADGSSLLKVYYGPTATTLMNVGGSSYYLQSAYYKSNSGIKLDLASGYMVAYDKTGDGSYVRIDGDGTPFFKVWDAGSSTYLVNFGSKNYFMQSAGYPQSGGIKINFSAGGNTAHVLEGGLDDGTTNAKWYIQQNGYSVFNYITATTGGKIGPFTVSSTALYTGSNSISGTGVYLGSSGLGVASGKFQVDTSGNTTLAGVIKGVNDKWGIDASGNATFENLKVTKTGEIGPLVFADTTGDMTTKNSSLKITAGSCRIQMSTTSVGIYGGSSYIYVSGSGDDIYFIGSDIYCKAGATFHINGNGAMASSGTLTMSASNGLHLNGSVYVNGESLSDFVEKKANNIVEKAIAALGDLFGGGKEKE
jgi:hypothetical protein